MPAPNQLPTPGPGKVIDMGAEARKAWGDQWSKPDTAYEFSNGKKFEDPGANGGPYKQP